jgi:hypothetical protein
LGSVFKAIQGKAGVSIGSELMREHEFDRGIGENYGDKQDELDQLTDEELLDEVIEQGEDLNIGGFPAYDIAVKAKKNRWKITPRQREAMINVMAHYHAFGE